ncbi:uncharacterized protein BCR38DRAFT_334936 [Pseudomassariella vexata]|uniref:RING-type E3 ubiquitin transferase n=1 Tax=Pseudomassariella vexata TaxID=1141098 RepID=A0A1Y2E9E2_9PEZI|nr:uncharacterized protein BCR38DRAFT_334936 [Pseudomassariella vexata]ORY68198.1 hypothetical protein BCR38DRAFT_334936 [Pseudomassariella vexata]
MDLEASEAFDIRSEVLQSTLAEIEIGNSSSKSSPASTEECCVICLDQVHEPCEARPCGHKNFDFLCLLNWLEKKAKCPLCKADITKVRYGFEERQNHLLKKWKTYAVPEPHSYARFPSAQNGSLLSRSHPRRQASESRALETARENDAIRWRREVYVDQLYSLHVGSNQFSRYRELSPQQFQSDTALVSRARMWLRRELKVFRFLHTPSAPQNSHNSTDRRRAENPEFLLEYIIAILKHMDIQGSQGQAEELIQEFLGCTNTRLLLHELKNFLRSPYTSLEEWDRNVQYDESRKRRAALEKDVTTSTRLPLSQRRNSGAWDADSY